MRYSICLLLFVLCFDRTLGQPHHGLTDAALHVKIVELDSIMFSVMYTCDYRKNETFYSEDVEFYHDRNGLIARSREEIMARFKIFCDQSNEVRITRQLVRSTSQVFPMNNFGAVQLGDHLIFTDHLDTRERIVTRAKFIKLWKYTNGQWQVKRVISYDHQEVK